MSKSIRVKVSLYVSGFTLFFIIALMIAVGLGFDRYFYEVKKDNMIQSSQSITRIYQEQGLDGEEQMDEISRNLGADVLIVDNSQLVYSSHPGFRKNMNKFMHKPGDADPDKNDGADEDKKMDKPDNDMKPPKHIQEMFALVQGDKPNESEIGQVRYYKPDPNFQYFYLINRISEHTYLLMMRPVAPLQESVDIFQRFIFTLGAIWLVIAIAGSVWFSRRITNPMLELRRQSTAMTRLNFSKRWNHTWDDEIGQLGNSLNTLSDQLSMALEELKKSNAKLKKQLDKAKEVEHMRKSFISAVSHELKTPLAIIQGYAEGLDSLDVDEKTRNQYCNIIRSETEKMDKLVKDLLNLSRVETGSFRIEQTIFDFGALVDEAKNRFANVIEKKNVQICWNLPAELTVYGDPERYDTILTNFLNNAIDYTDAGKKIEVSAEDIGDAYKISVYNQGIQIDPEYQKRIWEPFYKVDSSRARKERIFGGHGLGLGIVAALVKLHNQQYGMYNSPDGVTFWFTIAKRGNQQNVKKNL